MLKITRLASIKALSLDNLLAGALFLYLLGLSTSMAVMTGAAWLIVLLFAVRTVYLFFRRQDTGWVFSELSYPLVGFWIVITVGAIVGPKLSGRQLIEAVDSQRWIIVFLFLVPVLHSQFLRMETIVKTLLIVGFSVAVFGLVQAFTGVDPFRKEIYKAATLGVSPVWRVKGFFSNAITFGNSFGMLFAFLAGVLFYGKVFLKGPWRIASQLALALMVVVLILSFTRGLWLGLAVAIVVMSLQLSIRSTIKLVAVASLLATLTYLTYPAMRDRVDSSFSVKSGAVSDRLRLWQSHWTMVKENPVFGIGYNQNWERIQEYHKKTHGRKGMYGHAHNNYLQVLATSGIAGLLGFLALIYMTFMLTFRGLRNAVRGSETHSLYLGLLGAFICFHVAGLTESSFVDGEVIHMHGFFLALLGALSFRKARGKWA